MLAVCLSLVPSPQFLAPGIWHLLLRRVLLGVRRGRSIADGVAAGPNSTSGIKVCRQGMGAETELHERFCLGQAGYREPVVGLVAPHRLARLIVPAAIRLCIQIACLDQSLLDFLDAFRFRTQQSPPAPRRG